MTYGWAILIVVVVVAALYSMDVFTVSTPVPYSGLKTTDFAYFDHSSTELAIKIGPRALTINGKIYQPQAVARVETGCAANYTAWGDGKCPVNITYNVTASGLTHTSTGTLYAK